MRVFAFVDCVSLPARLEQQVRPWLRNKPVAVVDGPTGRLVSASPEPGRRNPSAASRTASLPALGRAAMTVVELSPSLCTWGRRTVIEAVGPMAAWLGEHPTGVLAALPKTWSPEPWALAAREALCRLLGFDLPLGIGSSKLVCRIAASQSAVSQTVVEQGHEAAFLGPMPLETLPSLKGEWGRVLRTMGLSTVEEVRRLPLGALTAGLGLVGDRVYAEARGLDAPCGDAAGINLWVSRRLPRPNVTPPPGARAPCPCRRRSPPDGRKLSAAVRRATRHLARRPGPRGNGAAGGIGRTGRGMRDEDGPAGPGAGG